VFDIQEEVLSLQALDEDLGLYLDLDLEVSLSLPFPSLTVLAQKV
jgi:hypothetical protein